MEPRQPWSAPTAEYWAPTGNEGVDGAMVEAAQDGAGPVGEPQPVVSGREPEHGHQRDGVDEGGQPGRPGWAPATSTTVAGRATPKAHRWVRPRQVGRSSTSASR